MNMQARKATGLEINTVVLKNLLTSIPTLATADVANRAGEQIRPREVTVIL